MSNMLLNKIEFGVLGEFGGDYSKRNYGRAIAKKLKINQKTISNVLIKLEKEHILKFEREGKNKYYFFNKLNPNIKEIIKLIELNKKIEFLDKHNVSRTLFRELEKRTSGILVIFGSFAKKQETKNSDLDLFVIGGIKKIKDLEDSYKIKINIIKAKKTFSRKEPFFREIVENHIILKGDEDFINLIEW